MIHITQISVYIRVTPVVFINATLLLSRLHQRDFYYSKKLLPKTLKIVNNFLTSFRNFLQIRLKEY